MSCARSVRAPREAALRRLFPVPGVSLRQKTAEMKLVLTENYSSRFSPGCDHWEHWVRWSFPSTKCEEQTQAPGSVWTDLL